MGICNHFSSNYHFLRFRIYHLIQCKVESIFRVFPYFPFQIIVDAYPGTNFYRFSALLFLFLGRWVCGRALCVKSNLYSVFSRTFLFQIIVDAYPGTNFYRCSALLFLFLGRWVCGRAFLTLFIITT